MTFFQVAVNIPISNSILTYQSELELKPGELVEVPLGRRKSSGVVLRRSSKEEIESVNKEKVKEIIAPIEGDLSLDTKEIELYQWMAQYYHYSVGKLIFDCMPKFLKRPRKVSIPKGDDRAIELTLTDEQEAIVTQVSSQIGNGFSQNFIHGVTGSGKSLVFLNLIKKTIENGQSVQFLLPEINLTPQFIELFQSYLSCDIYSYHSGVSASEKYVTWKNLKQSNGPVFVMGVRSSLFLPVPNLGLVIVDEEHDSSFKQNDRCPYHARDVAIKKAQVHSCPIILGSATPSLETYYNFSKLEHPSRSYFTLKNRVGKGAFPKLELIDIRDRFQEDDPCWPFADETLKAIEEAVERKEQVLIFVNKLGFSNYVQCRACGHQFKNEQCGCDNNLRYFKRKNLLSCSHCEFKMSMPSECPDCGSITLLNRGFGTEKVQDVLSKVYPQYRVERFDRDEIQTSKQLVDKLDRFHSHEIDIFVGTQMLAKGHNFKRVNLVVILGVDSMLGQTDFRASEKTYQLTEQVSGRAGRYSEHGKVMIQTMNPEHQIFTLIQQHAFDEFYHGELELRNLCRCPPFTRLAMVYFSSRFRDRLVDVAAQVGKALMKTAFTHYPDVQVLGPAPMSIEKKAHEYTWAIMLKSDQMNQLHGLVKSFESGHKTVSGVSVKVDIDSQTVL